MDIESLKGRVLTVEQAAELLPYSLKHIQKLCRLRILDSNKVPRGRKWLINGDSLYKLLADLSKALPQEAAKSAP